MHLRLLMIVALFTAGCGSLGSPSEPVGAANGKAEQPKPKIKVFFHQILPVNEPPEPDLDDPFAQLPSVPIDDELAALQVKVLNDYFQPLGFKFINQGIDQTLSDEWYAREDKLTPEMYWYFRCGTPGDFTPPTEQQLKDCKPSRQELHVYIVSAWAEGMSFRPSRLFGEYPDYAYYDGAILGQTLLPFDADLTSDELAAVRAPSVGVALVHEVGHWLDLKHVFSSDGSCDDADGIADTPPAATMAIDCRATLDSCPGDDRPDDVNNVMNYSSEHCAKHFTDGQKAAMHNAWELYRP
ncbi:MAG: hypothetical protein H6707_03700 [Deltaproteobacteria bacterium]|nr:hypothetical protein [Deltaproteobacteria bacterium]